MNGSFKLSDRQAELTRRLEAAGFPGHWWGREFTGERFYFADYLKKAGKPIRGCSCWLQFDEPETLEGAALRSKAPKRWYEVALAQHHAAAFVIAVELADPMAAAQLRLEMSVSPREVGDMVSDE